MIIFLWMMGVFFIYNLSNRSSVMLKENYQTVESTGFLIQAIDEMKNQQIRRFMAGRDHFDETVYRENKEIFEDHLNAVKNNITESGERLLIEELTVNFAKYIAAFNELEKKDNSDYKAFIGVLVPEYTQTRNLILDLWDMNMQAISHKNSLLKNTAHRALVLISLIGTVCFLISILFLFRYPGNIARPINELIKGISEISNRNYRLRLRVNTNDEFGKVAEAFNAMAAKLDEYEHSNLSKVLYEKKRIDTLISNMNDAIIGLDNGNEIIFSNSYACQILNIKESALVGKNAREVSAGNPVFRKIIEDVLDNSSRESKEFKPLRLELGERVRYFAREVLNVDITLTGETFPERAGMVIVLKNITRFLEQDEAKTNFMATLSHELKTPISSLRLNLKLLNDPRIGVLNDEQKQIIDALTIESGKMLTITTELLDLAQVETGNIQLNLQPVDTLQLFAYVREISAGSAESRDIRIHFESDQRLPPIKADYQKTAWVLMNLINNAIQYSGAASKIIVSASQLKKNVVYSVHDTGKGIDKQYLDLIFEKFFRVPGTGEKGTGLGLAISKELISKQNGRIWAESIPGKGSSFYFSLPVYS